MRFRFLVLSPFLACVRTTPQPPPEQPPPVAAVSVPEGCLAPLGGTWVHALERGYRYEGTDDGGALELVVTGRPAPDAGFVPRKFRRDAGPDAAALDAGVPDAGEDEPTPLIHLSLTRTASGFVGATFAPVRHPSGRLCDARFETTVVSCADGGLVLETATATALSDTCQAPAVPGELARQTHALIRAPGGDDVGREIRAPGGDDVGREIRAPAAALISPDAG